MTLPACLSMGVRSNTADVDSSHRVLERLSYDDTGGRVPCVSDKQVKQGGASS